MISFYRQFKNNPMYVFLLMLSLATIVGFQAWRTLFNNFSVEIAHINGLQMGTLQSVREIPGFLALLVIYLLLIISEHRLASIAVAALGAGVALTGVYPHFYGLIFTTIIMSIGFHYFETVNQSLTLQYFSKRDTPLVIANLRSISSLASIITGGAILIALNFLSYQLIFIIFGTAVITLAIYTLTKNPINHSLPPQHKKMILRSKYWLYYVLTFFAGARRQIFVAFSLFLMVERFQFTTTEIALLFILNNAINIFVSPIIGKSINRFGERKVLSLEYFSLMIIFTAYAYVESKAVIAVLYILDHIFFNFSMAIRTYFQKIADNKDIAPSMAVGFTINHIAAVIIPVLGGMLWMVDYRITFIAAVVISLLSLIFVQFIPTYSKK
jgi:hypothetical protein